jgi:hypothetical protein
MKKMLLIVSCCAIAVVILWFVSNSVIQSQSSKALPYEDSSQMTFDINNLPAIGIDKAKLDQRDWEKFISVSKRMKSTDPAIVESGIELASKNTKLVRFGGIKMMILLRVCFKCPSNEWQTNVYGGWVSFSAQSAGRRIQDMNWPVGKAFGCFYLIDTIDGYTGQPYDPVAEYRWMKSHCEWRKF